MIFHAATIAFFVSEAVSAWAVGESHFSAADIIEKDVAIIGGGASGTHTAVRLREDYGVSVVVVESEDHLGGHVNTYVDPESGVAIDYGVLAYLRYGHAADFFARFGIPIKPFAQAPQNSLYVSTSNSELLTDYTPPSFPEQIAAFQNWLKLTQKYSKYLLPGLWNFPNGSNIPAELLMPYGETAKEYNLQATAPLFASISNVGVGGMKDVLTLYTMFAMGRPVTSEFLNSSLFVPDGFSNSELYRRAYNLLADDVLLNSRVLKGDRDGKGVKLLVTGKGCNDKVIKAKKLLFTLPPSLHNLEPFNINAYEREVLSTWTGTWSFAAVVQALDVPANTSVYWYSPEVGTSDYLAQRNSDYTMSMTAAPDVPGEEHLFEVLLTTNYSISHAGAKAKISEMVRKLCDGGALTSDGDSAGNCGMTYRAFVDHNSVIWRQSPSQLKDNIVKDIYALQGCRNTWFTGGLWSEDYTGNVWAFTNSLIPRLLESLEAA